MRFTNSPCFFSVSPSPFETERDDGKQVFNLRENPLFDYFTDLFIARPGGILSTILGARPQREFDDLVAEILGVGDPAGFSIFAVPD